MRIIEEYNMISNEQTLADYSKLAETISKHSKIKDLEMFDIRQVLNEIRYITLKYTNEDI